MKKKIVSILLSVSVLVGLLAGCGQTETESKETADTTVSESTETEASTTEEKEIPTLRVLAPETAGLTGDFNENATVLYLEEELGIDLEFELVPTDVLKERVTLAITSQDLPDIIYLPTSGNVLSTDELLKYGQSGVFVPIEGMLEESFPNLYGFLTEKTDNGIKDITEMDGHIYATPTIGESGHMKHAVKTWANQAFLDALDMDMPETLEEFEAYLKGVKEQDVNGNGDPDDEIGLVGMANDSTWFHYLMNSFVYVGSDRQYGALLYSENETGNVYCSNVQDGYREGLRYINSLWEQGLIYEESMTMSQDQLKALMASEEPIIGALGNFAPFTLGYENPTYTNLRIMAPLSNNGKQGISPWAVNGKNYQITPGAGIITSACEDVEAAARFLDFHYTAEGQMIFFCGPDWQNNEYVVLAEAGDVDFDGNPAGYKTFDGEKAMADNHCLANFQIRFNLKGSDGKLFSQAYDTSTDIYGPGGLTALLYKSTYVLDEYESDEYDTIQITTRVPAEVAQTITDIKTQMNSYALQWDTDFIMGNKSLDDDWDEYVDGLYQLGLQTVIDAYEEALK